MFIEGLKTIGANIIDHCEEYRTPLNILHENVNLTRDSERKNLKNLYEQIKQSIDTAKKTILLIDDLSIFVSLGYMEADVTIFCHYLRSLLRCSQNGLSIATLIHCSSTLDIENDSLVHDAEYHSDATIFVQPLQTGYSRDVSGEVGIIVEISDFCNIRQNLITNYIFTMPIINSIIMMSAGR